VAKQIIERGEIGEPVRFRGRFDQVFFNDPALPWSWRCSRELAGTSRIKPSVGKNQRRRVEPWGAFSKR
jgi:GFO/IDH/MocA oxidoreductase family protein